MDLRDEKCQVHHAHSDNESSSDHEIPDPTTNQRALADAKSASDEQHISRIDFHGKEEDDAALSSDDDGEAKLTDKPILISCDVIAAIYAQYQLTPDFQDLQVVPEEWIPVLQYFDQQAELKQRYAEDDPSDKTSVNDNAANCIDSIGMGLLSHFRQCTQCKPNEK